MSAKTDDQAEALALLLLTFLGFFINAMVMQDAWRWFVVPLGVQAIGYWHAMGLLLLFRWASFQTSGTTTLTRMIASLLLSLVVWLLAYWISFGVA